MQILLTKLTVKAILINTRFAFHNAVKTATMSVVTQSNMAYGFVKINTDNSNYTVLTHVLSYELS